MTRKGKKYIRVPYAQAVYGKKEIEAVVRVLKNPTKITAGDVVNRFENQIAQLFGKKHGVMVNSGSSANLIAIEALDLPKGSEVITPALTFATTIAPLLQKGLVPVFIDVKPGTYQIDLDKIESRITKKTRVLMIPSLIGNLPDLKKLKSIARKYGLYFIEDSCDTLGASFYRKPTGYYSDISTTSFYASHIITAAGTGGMVCFHKPGLAKRAKILANWGRLSTLFGVHEKSEDIKKRFKGKIGEIPYDAKFIFSEIGYNFQSNELSGAFGLEQLKRLKKFTVKRQRNFKKLFKFFADYENWFELPIQHKGTITNWLSFPLTIKKDAPFSRKELTVFLEKRNIQTRPIFTGNILSQPAFRHLKTKGGNNRDFPVADYIMKGGFLLGAHHGITDKQINYLKKSLREFLSKYN